MHDMPDTVVLDQEGMGFWVADIKIGSMMRKYSQVVGVQSPPVGLVRVLNFSILTRHGHHVLVPQLDG